MANKRISSPGRKRGVLAYGAAWAVRQWHWRSLLPALIGLAFVVLAALLVLVYRGGDDDADGGAGSPGVSGPTNPGVAASFTLPAVDGGTVSLVVGQFESPDPFNT